MISIIMLVHNAKKYTVHSIKTLMQTDNRGSYELIVVDNDSNKATKKALLKLEQKVFIDKLLYLNENTLFAKGNNIGSKICSDDSDYILLLNSDVEIRNKEWLDLMLKLHPKKGGITTLGICPEPYLRGDGYALLIDKSLYLKYKLDENFEWWWSVTKLQALVLKDDYEVIAVQNHDDILYHFGGMSGGAWQHAKGLNTEGEEIKRWYQNRKVKVIKELDVDISKNIKCKKSFAYSHKVRNMSKKIVKKMSKRKNELFY